MHDSVFMTFLMNFTSAGLDPVSSCPDLGLDLGGLDNNTSLFIQMIAVSIIMYSKIATIYKFKQAC